MTSLLELRARWAELDERWAAYLADLTSDSLANARRRAARKRKA